MKENNLETSYIHSCAGWSFICRAADMIEVWKTPTRWLVCSHYDGVYRFVDHQNEINDQIQEVFKILQERYSLRQPQTRA